MVSAAMVSVAMVSVAVASVAMASVVIASAALALALYAQDDCLSAWLTPVALPVHYRYITGTLPLHYNS